MMPIIASDRSYAVLGVGLSGTAAVRYLCALGLSPVVVDENAEALEALQKDFPQLTYCTELSAAVFAGVDQLVVSPGVDIGREIFTELGEAGVQMISEVDLFARGVGQEIPVAAVTGSNGKSTVTELLRQMALRHGVNCELGGNTDTPAVELLERPAADMYVLELSSFQLEHLYSLSPSVSCVLNISPDHLDRHGDLLTYRNTKHRIYREADCAVSNRDDILTQPLLPRNIPQVTFGQGIGDPGHWGLDLEGDNICYGFEAVMPCSELSQNHAVGIANAMASLAIGTVLQLDLDGMLNTLRTFEPLPFRFQQIADINGVIYINDSKATNPGATVEALRSLTQGQVRLICGGSGKQLPYDELKPLLHERVLQMLVLGDEGRRLAALVGDAVPVVFCGDMDEAVRQATASANAGDVVLLSPACSSFGLYTDYRERGRAFNQAVEQIRKI